MRARLILALLLALPLALGAQTPEPQTPDIQTPNLPTSDEDKGFLTNFLEENLSGAGREVRIEGFAGALSSRATIDRLTIADDRGVWLTLSEVGLSWSRSALLSGRVEVAELSAARIELARLPDRAGGGAPAAAAEPFRLPELPVSVEIGRIAADQVILRPPVLGQQVAVSLTGALRLDGGEGAAALAIARTDGTAGTLGLKADYANATGQASLTLDLTEPAGGIAARLMNLPGRPALELALEGQGALPDFAARLRLASDGAERLAGTLTLGPDAQGRPGFALAAGGDIAPLFLPEYAAFFGDAVSLSARGHRRPDGGTVIEALGARSAALEIDGSLSLAPDGLPEAAGLTARLGMADGAAGGTAGDTAVPLPLAGPITSLRAAAIGLDFDAARGPDWRLEATLAGLERGSSRLEHARLAGSGRIERGPEGRRATGAFELAALGLTPGDPALGRALGPDLSAGVAFLWRDGLPLIFSRAGVQARGLALSGNGTLGAVAEGLPLRLRARAGVDDLSAFSDLAGRALGGAAELSLRGVVHLLDGRFDLTARGQGQDIAPGPAALDRVLAGASRLELDARRDETGLTLRRLTVEAPGGTARAGGRVAPGATDLSLGLDARAPLLLPGAPRGEAALQATARETGPGTYAIDLSGQAPGADLVLEATLRAGDGPLSGEGRLTARAENLAPYSALAGRKLAGALVLAAEGRADALADTYALNATLDGTDLALGLPALDPLLRGTLHAEAEASRAGGITEIRRLIADTTALSASLSGRLGGEDGAIDARARIADLGLLVADLSGPASAEGRFTRRADGRIGTAITATGPGGSSAEVAGTLAADLTRADLSLRGAAPLAMANAALAPRALQGTARFDLGLAGPLALPSLSGEVRTEGARLIAPTEGIAVADLAGTARLAGGRAALDLAGRIEGGGRAALSGNLALARPFDADLVLRLSNARIADPGLFRTEVTGDVTLTGPLTGGALIAGLLELGETEVRVAETGRGMGGEVPGLVHLGESPAQRLTRERAGFVETQARGGPARAWPLDLTIRAPNRIFLRGRGLDAELGGALGLRGTTADVLPQGEFGLIRGRLDILGRRLALDEGSARLEGSFDPWVRLVASTEADDITVRVIVEGPASAPEFRFESAPQLPEDEILARLLFGRSIDQLSPLQAARLASAVATLAGRGGSGTVNRLRERFGLDDLDVTTDQTGAASISAGRYINDRVYTEATVDEAGETGLSINLDLGSGFTLKGSAEGGGETGIGLFFQRDY